MSTPLAIARPAALLRRAFAPAGGPRAESGRLSARVDRLADLPRRSRWVCGVLMADPRLRAGPLMGTTLGRILDRKREDAPIRKEQRRSRSPGTGGRSERRSSAAWPAKRPTQRADLEKGTPPRPALAVHALPKIVPTAALDPYCPASKQPTVKRSRAMADPWENAAVKAPIAVPPLAALADWRRALTKRVEGVLAKGSRPDKDEPIGSGPRAHDAPWVNGLDGPIADLKLLSDLAYERPVRRPGDRAIPEQANAPLPSDAATPSSDRKARSASGSPVFTDQAPAGGREDAAMSPRPAGAPSDLRPSLDPRHVSSDRSAVLDPRDEAQVDPTDPLFTTAGIDLQPPSQLAPRIAGAPEEHVALPGPARAEVQPAEPGSAPSHAPRTGRLVADNHELAKRLSRILRDEARRHGIDV